METHGSLGSQKNGGIVEGCIGEGRSKNLRAGPRRKQENAIVTWAESPVFKMYISCTSGSLDNAMSIGLSYEREELRGDAKKEHEVLHHL